MAASMTCLFNFHFVNLSTLFRKFNQCTPKAFIKNVDLIRRVMKSNNYGLQDGCIYKRLEECEYTYIYFASVKIYLLNILGNFEIADIIKSHITQVTPPPLKLSLLWWGGFRPRSFYPSASTRRTQLTVAAKVVRPTDILHNVRYWFTID